jgi:predicted lipid carrier protein YhbT
LRSPPPFSPLLLAGLALRPLPPAALQPGLTLALRLIQRHHPEVFDRLDGLTDPVYLIDPVDLPLVFVLRPCPPAGERSSLVVREDAEGIAATAIIRGPLLTLLELLEGRSDGDAHFFTRELVIEGDTAAVVALRNTVDAAEIDLLADALSHLGPFAESAHRLAGWAFGLFDRARRDLETLRAALIAPAIRRVDAHAGALRELEESVAQLRRPGRGAPSRS